MASPPARRSAGCLTSLPSNLRGSRATAARPTTLTEGARGWQDLQGPPLAGVLAALVMHPMIERGVFRPPRLIAAADSSRGWQDLRGPQLAAVLAALVMPEVITRPGMRAATQASEEALEAVFALDPLQAHLADLQQDAGLLLPLEMDVRLSGGPARP